MRSQALSVKFSAELVKQMTEAAKSSYISRSAFIRQAVAEKLNRENVINKVEVFDWEKLLDEKD